MKQIQYNGFELEHFDSASNFRRYQVSLIKDKKAKSELELDINEMTAMLDSYVSFVKTESPETIENIVINDLIFL